MTYEDILAFEKHYVAMFSSIEATRYGYIASDSMQRDKYYHNYLHVYKTNQISQNELGDYEAAYKKYGHVHFRFEEKPTGFEDVLKDYKPSVNGYYWAPINDVKIPKVKSFDIQIIEPSIKESFCHYLYLENREYGEQFSVNNAIRQWEVLMKQTDYRYFYAILDGHIVGSINVTWSDQCAKIDDFTVLEPYRHQGIGSALMAHAISFLKTKQTKFVYLVTDMNDTPRFMYEKWGYHHLSSCYHFIKVYPNLSEETK
ncbi:MAG TPA: GNAT family N-acetyltransferase [Bacilli bacterium]|nr:GNAT family N-acetyltransferase [Bacilli bacterium]